MTKHKTHAEAEAELLHLILTQIRRVRETGSQAEELGKLFELETQISRDHLA